MAGTAAFGRPARAKPRGAPHFPALGIVSAAGGFTP